MPIQGILLYRPSELPGQKGSVALLSMDIISYLLPALSMDIISYLLPALRMDIISYLLPLQSGSVPYGGSVWRVKTPASGDSGGQRGPGRSCDTPLPVVVRC